MIYFSLELKEDLSTKFRSTMLLKHQVYIWETRKSLLQEIGIAPLKSTKTGQKITNTRRLENTTTAYSTKGLNFRWVLIRMN